MLPQRFMKMLERCPLCDTLYILFHLLCVGVGIGRILLFFYWRKGKWVMEKTKEQFLALQSREDVANILGIKEKSLRFFLYVIKTDNMYTEFTIQKKGGGQRTICAPNKKLKNVQRKLANVLNCVYKVKPAAHGFVYDKDIVTNARNHTKKRFVFNIDLENFFEQINFGRVRGMLLKPPYEIGEEAATVIAQIACYKGRLPQGAPSSPILTNMICSPLDTQLTKLAVKYKLRYSRYADDITFSSYKEDMPSSIVSISSKGVVIGKELSEIIKRNGFNINESKSRIFDYHKRQEVTGLVVNRFVNVKRSYIKEIRAILDHCKKTSVYEAAKEYIRKGKCKNHAIEQMIENETEENQEKVKQWFIEVLKGRLEYIRHVKGSSHFVFIKYAKELNELCGENVFEIEGKIELLEKAENSVFILQAITDDGQGSGFILKDVGLITNYHVTDDNEIYRVKTYKGMNVTSISNDMNLIYSNKDIDYAVYKFGSRDENALELGTSKAMKIGTKVFLIGYPDYNEGNFPEIQKVSIISIRPYMGQTVYIVSGRVVHGASGGVVLNEDCKVVGIIRCGAATIKETEDYPIQGFIPIDEVIDDIRKQQQG